MGTYSEEGKQVSGWCGMGKRNEEAMSDEYQILLKACVGLREQLDVTKNPGLIGSAIEVVLQAAADIKQLKTEIERLKHEWQQAKEAVEHVRDGKPLGELVGKQIIINQQVEIERLKAIAGCQCICHDFPEHGNLQDVLAANRFHCAEIARLKAELGRLTNTDTIRRVVP